jgi:hypothetical protein
MNIDLPMGAIEFSDLEKTCSRCKWWKAVSTVTAETGACRHESPGMDGNGIRVWPITDRSDWCGSFQGKEAIA